MKSNEYKIIDFDFASLYPTTFRDRFDKTRFRREKIKRIMERINDKGTDKKLSS